VILLQVRLEVGLLGEVPFDDVVRLLVDDDVSVLLKFLNLVQALRLLDEASNRIFVVGRGVLAHLQHVLEGIQHHLDNPVVGAVKKAAERLDAAALRKVHDLLSGTTRDGVYDGPHRLLFDLKVVVILEDLNQWQDKVGMDHRVDLRRAPGCDVGDRPAGFPAQCLHWAV